MIRALAVGLLVLSGAPRPFIGLLLAGLVQPVLGLALIYTLSLRHRTGPEAGSRDAHFCGLVAAELRSGVSLRKALEAAAVDAGDADLERLCTSGRPYSELAAGTARLLPVVGPAAGAAVLLAGKVGGRVAGSFEALGRMADDEEEMCRERRTATAQVRASAILIASLPPLLLAMLVATGRTEVLGASGASGLGMMAAGAVLIVAGLVLIWGIVRAAEAAR